jgi:broad specificity phosphatase PhoE
MAIKLHTGRHEQSEYNVQKLITGNLDIALTPTGLDNANQMGAALVNLTIHRILTGELIRQKKTAQAIERDRGIEIVYDARMNERDLGKYQGVPYHKVNTEGLDILTYLARKDKLDDDSNTHIPTTKNTGEPIRVVKKKIRTFMDEQVWPDHTPDDECLFLVVSELWNVYFVNELFGNPTSQITGLCRLDNGHYNEYTIHIPRDAEGKRHPEKRIVTLERGNAPLRA